MAQYYGVTYKQGNKWLSDGLIYSKKAASKEVIRLRKEGIKAKKYPVRDETRGGPKNKDIHKRLNQISRRAF